MTALYLHIPFCLSRCHYCSFSSCAGREDLYEPYAEALMVELTGLAKSGSFPLGSLFIGGGTPTSLPQEILQGVIRHAFDLFGVLPGAEISVEANPGTLDGRYLETLLCAGVNRLSLGVQSFDNWELKQIGRIHSDEDACLAIQAARDAGFNNINLDLMYGLPGQTATSWRKSLTTALAFSPEHLSLYQLTIEPDTPFETFLENKTMRLPTEEETLQMDSITRQLCSNAGLDQYETSNYAIRGYECRHNINYWLNNDYLAAGASAVSCLQGVRERRVEDPAEYISRIGQNKSVVVERESLSGKASFRETVIMGLRMVKGVSRRVLYERYAMDLEDYYGLTLEKLIVSGFLELTDTHLRITEQGWPFSNRIMAELV
ncbi:MAG: radical SAM family heme chaperone HemW [Desulforhopalus sp.]